MMRTVAPFARVRKMRLLNLFGELDNVAIPWRENTHEVISVETDPRFNPEICKDILQPSYCKLPSQMWFGLARPVTNMHGAGPRPKHLET